MPPESPSDCIIQFRAHTRKEVKIVLPIFFLFGIELPFGNKEITNYPLYKEC